MEEFKKKIQMKYRLLSLFCCFATGIFGALRFLANNTNDFASGLITGAFTSMLIVSSIYLAKYGKALKNEDELKKMYIEETDERNVSITKETMRTASTISLMITALAVIVSGFFNPVVSIVLAAALLCDLIITIAVSVYYNKKM